MAQNHSKGDLCPKIESWELELVKKVAKAFRTNELEELESELAKKLLELKLNPPKNVRDWKSYLAKFLYNKASNIIRNWRHRESKFVSFTASAHSDDINENFSLENLLAEPQEDFDLRQDLSNIAKTLEPELRELWEILVEEGGDRGAAAKRLGKHRNTVTSWIEKIKEVLKKSGLSDD